MTDDQAAKLEKLSDIARTVSREDEDIRGRNVKARDGEDLGEVDDLLVDPTENKVRFLVVASGGFLGMGKTKSFIPVEAVSGITADEVHIDQSRDKIAGAPDYDPDLVEERGYYQDLYGYYGYTPYWAPGYIYPGYPYPRY
jgi:sporulation protein YlmC with PRC-barrel domain